MALLPQPSSPRRGDRVRLVAVHTAEGARTVESLDSYFRRTRTGSSHAGADNNRLVEGWVPYDRASWTLRSGNSISDNLELCAFAGWSRAEWLRHDNMLTHAARWIAQRCEARGIPCRKLTPAEVRAGESGVIGHHDWTIGMKDGTHWDPGPNFPWDAVMARANSFLKNPSSTPEGDDDLTPEQDNMLRNVYNAIFNGGPSMKDNGRPLVESIAHMQDVLWEGGVGTPHAETVAQRLMRVERATPKSRFAFWRNRDGELHEANILEGTYRRIDAERLEARKEILDFYRITYTDLTEQSPVTIPDAYGVEIKGEKE